MSLEAAIGLGPWPLVTPPTERLSGHQILAIAGTLLVPARRLTSPAFDVVFSRPVPVTFNREGRQ